MRVPNVWPDVTLLIISVWTAVSHVLQWAVISVASTAHTGCTRRRWKRRAWQVAETTHTTQDVPFAAVTNFVVWSLSVYFAARVVKCTRKVVEARSMRLRAKLERK